MAKNNRSSGATSSDTTLFLISQLTGITDGDKLRKLQAKIKNIPKSTRQALEESVVYTELYFPKLEQLCAEEHNQLISKNEEQLEYCCFNGSGKSYICERLKNPYVRKRIYGDLLIDDKRLVNQCMTSALGSTIWKQGKIVYRFDDDLYHEVCNVDMDEVIRIPTHIFKIIPSWSFYIETPQHSILEGVLCTSYIESVCKGETITILSMLGFCKIENPNLYEITIPLVEDETVGEMLDRVSRNSYLHDENCDFSPYEYAKIAVPLLMYLCMKNADLPDIKETTRKRPARKSTDNVSAENIIVGERVGAILREHRVRYSSTSSTASEGRDKSRKPHIRKSHFHCYWIGPRKDGRKGDCLIGKWLAPIPINIKLGETDELPATIHHVTK